MWAHYADNHKGICLGFDLPIGSEDGDPYAYKIKYKKKLIPMDSRVFTDEAYRQKMREIASKTKSKHWKYEKEWRYWFSLIGNGPEQKRADPNLLFYNSFDEKLVLKEVIFGARSRLSTCRVQHVLSPSEDVEFSTARPSFRAFKMVRQRNEKHQK